MKIRTKEIKSCLSIQLVKISLCITICLANSTCISSQYVTSASVGSVVINGDIEPVKDALNYVSFGVSREINNRFLIESKIGFGKAFGISPELAISKDQGGYLVEDEYNILGGAQWYPAYRNSLLMLDLSSNYRRNLGFDWLKILGGAGIGVTKSNRSLNLLGLEESIYDRDFSVLNSEKRIKRIKDYYDVTYETDFNSGSSWSAHLSLQVAIQIRLNDYLFINIEGRHHITSSDYIDVISYKTATEKTGNNDSVSMLSIGFVGYISEPVNTELLDD